MLVIGHRGSPRQFTENSWHSVEAALVADGAEVDIRLTADGHIVCFHDATTDRLGSVSLSLASSTLSELCALSLVNKRFHTAATSILTFEYLCRHFPTDKLLEIEVKCGIEVLPLLYKYLDNVSFPFKIICFSARLLAQIKLERPHYYTTMLLHMGFYFRTTGRRMTLEQISNSYKISQANAIGIHCNFFWSYELKYLSQRLDCDFSMWTVNSKLTADFFRELGCSSITTDIPTTLIH